MRTDKQTKLKSETIESSDSKEAMKVVRKSLHPLQVAAGDKENLVGAGRTVLALGEKDPKSMSLISKNTSVIASSPKREKKKTNKNLEKLDVVVEDLTSEAGPSEGYWQSLAETRRKALEKTLTENQQLHERLQQLTEENNKYKELLEEAQSIIDTLNEVISEMDNEEDNSNVVEDVIHRP